MGRGIRLNPNDPDKQLHVVSMLPWTKELKDDLEESKEELKESGEDLEDLEEESLIDESVSEVTLETQCFARVKHVLLGLAQIDSRMEDILYGRATSLQISFSCSNIDVQRILESRAAKILCLTRCAVGGAAAALIKAQGIIEFHKAHGKFPSMTAKDPQEKKLG